MTTATELNGIKLNLIDWINGLTDAEIITFLDGLRISNSKKDWWNELSIQQQKQVLAGLQDANNENVLESNEFWSKLKNT